MMRKGVELLGQDEIQGNPHRILTTLRSRSFLVGLVCTSLVGLMTVYLLHIRPTKRGFFCDDDSIRYPMIPETVPMAQVMYISLAIVFATIFVVEMVRHRQTTGGESSNLLKNIFETLGVFFFGLLFVWSFTALGKFSIGRLRPYFYNVCNPRSDVCSPGKEHVYITDYECTGDPDMIKEARQSFPSGHTSYAFYVAVYLWVFLQQRMTWTQSRFIVIVCQSGLLMLACFTALSRVMDYKHHPTDILGGIVIGAGLALFMAFCAIDMRLVSSVSQSSSTPKMGQTKLSA